MDRRTFLAHLARTPVLGSTGTLAAQETSAHGPDVDAPLAYVQTPVAGTGPLLAEIDPLHAALLVLDYQPA